MLMKCICVMCGGALLLAAFPGWSAEVNVAQFSKSNLQGWEEKSVSGHTEYALAEEDGRTVLAANSKASASGYFRRIEVDLSLSPVLKWTWKVEKALPPGGERNKSGDDYAARIYVVFSEGPALWKTRVLNYVWSSHQPVGSQWENASSATSRMFAVESGNEQVGQWRAYQRNIRDDYKKQFGEDITHAQAIAVMTDTDDTRQTAAAFYGDIVFASE